MTDKSLQKLYPGKPLDTFFFTSECVSEGHPDKICDQVSDTILDECLKQDPHSKVALETATKTGVIYLLGEITTKAVVDFQTSVRNTIKWIGFDHSSKGFDYDTCGVVVQIEQQSPDIAQGAMLEEMKIILVLEIKDICSVMLPTKLMSVCL